MLKRTWIVALGLFVAGCQTASGGGGGSVDPALEGSWYAGRGGTTLPYDAQTGTFGAPTGDGMLFVFRSDGTYTKATQSIVSNPGCSTGYVAFEEGDATTQGSELRLHPSRGHLETVTCGGATTDEPLDVKDETLDYAVGPFSQDPSIEALTLHDGANGTSAEFRQTHGGA